MAKFTLTPKEDNTTTFSVRVKDNLLEQYEQLSRTTKRSRNELINIAIDYFLETVELQIPSENIDK